MKVARSRYWLLSLAAVLAGCGVDEMTDLKTYVEEVRSRSEAPIEPIPEIRQPEIYAYRARLAEQRDPFTPEMPPEEPSEGTQNGIGPDESRDKEELEAFPLDTLRMVGTVARDENRWALVQDKQGVIYRVRAGNYLGQNHGRITEVFDDRVELIEIVPDRAGGYAEQPAVLALGE